MRKTGAAAFILVLAGCRVGPKYQPPAAPVPQAPSYKGASPSTYKDAMSGAWRPANPKDAMLKGKWWEIFHEPELNALEEQLNIDNQNIAQFFQNFMAARAQVREARAGYFPVIGVSASASASRAGSFNNVFNNGTTGTTTGGTPTTPGGSTNTVTGNGSGVGSSIFTQFALPFEASWAPDLWGRVRNTVREFTYAAQVSAADLENERLTEQATLAVFYFQVRGQDSLQDLYNRTIVSYREALRLTQRLFQTGIDSQQAVEQAQTTLSAAEAAGTNVAINRAIYEHAIATLIGKPASDFSLPVRLLATPTPAIPIGVPSELLERRPDIAAAERTMAEANALIGVGTAAFYPSLNLSASGGIEASRLSNLFSAAALFWSVGATASQTIFEGGLRRATIAQYTAAYNADVAQYRQTVLTAFQQVEDYLATLRVNSQAIIQQEEAVRAAQQYLELAITRYKTGIDPYLNVINAQTTLLSDQITLITMRVTQIASAVQLIQSLGGGWDRTQLPSESQVTSTDAKKRVQGPCCK